MRESRWRSMSIMDLHKRKSSSSSLMSGGCHYQEPQMSSATTATTVTTAAAAAGGPEPMVNSGQQSFELIKSTQSLVERLHLNAEDITIQPVHPSIIGQDTWFQITYTSSGTTRYFSCQNTKERDDWIQSLKKTLMLNQDRRRTDNCLKIGVLEVKGLSDKNKYFVEIHIDDKLYARTSSKKMNGMCFWGEHFEFKDLPSNTEKIQLLIHKDKGQLIAGRANKKPKKPVGRVRISVPSIQSRYVHEKWHAVEKSSRRENPSIRLKCQFQSVDILPVSDYEDFLYFLKDEYKTLVKLLEPNISVKVKEELSYSLMTVFHAEEIAEDVLAEIVVDEISNVENEHLTFRGNSIATKAMEAYIKLVGQKYLVQTLQTVITEIITSDQDLEIDPIKVNHSDMLSSHRRNLMSRVRQVWNRISHSFSYFPVQLQRCFYKIRQYLNAVGKPELGDNLISSCIFLRYLCPAILSPSLFNLSDEYPGPKANRNLTLIAKTLQTLANFNLYEGKENSMEFLNPFLAEESRAMKDFLHQISSSEDLEDSWIPNLGSTLPMDKNDLLGRHLSCLHTILSENITQITSSTPENTNNHSKTSVRLREILDEINGSLHRPTIPQLEQISQPTMKTLEKLQRQNSSEKSFTSGLQLPWSWTLPKKTRGGNYSHPAPHHEAPKTTFFIKKNNGTTTTSSSSSSSSTTTNSSVIDGVGGVGISLSSDTSSSASLTPSPGSQIKDASRRTWLKGGIPGGGGTSGGGGGIQRRTGPKLFPSSMSLDDTDSSDDSIYSSQYQSDTNNHARLLVPGNNSSTSHTLPRPLTGGNRNSNNTMKTLSDYEVEIMELRNDMVSLQLKLGEAERKLRDAKEGKFDKLEVQEDENEMVKSKVNRLLNEEDKLRRDQINMSGEREMMILMQQKKIAALDNANERLRSELTRLGEKLKLQQQQQQQNSEVSIHHKNEDQQQRVKIFHKSSSVSNLSKTLSETPKTVDELLDSLHSTPI